MGSRTFRNPPAPTTHAHNAAQKEAVELVSATWLTAPVFNVGCAEIAATDFRKNHHKKILNGQ